MRTLEAPAARRPLLRRLPRPTLHLFRRSLPSWRVLAVIGATLGLAVWAALAARFWSWGLVAGVAFANLASFRLVATLDSWRAGGRRLVLLHHLIASGSTTALIALALHAPVLPVADRWAVGFLLVLAFGRVGCFLVGCCYGRVSRWGTWYPFRALGPLRQATGRAVSLLPVQLIEASAILALFGGALWLVLADSSPGTALSLSLGGYAATRFACELGRGDPRPYWRALSQAQLECGLLFLVALAANPTVGVLSLSLALVTGLLLRTRFGPPPVFALRESSLAAFREQCAADIDRGLPAETPLRLLCEALRATQPGSTSSSSPSTSRISSTSDSTSSSSSMSRA